MTSTARRPVEPLTSVPGLGGSDWAELATLIRPGWRRDARCDGRTEVDWFTDDLAGQHAAIEVCRACPVRLSCLAAALLGDELGIWGGTTEADRDQLRFDLWFGVGS